MYVNDSLKRVLCLHSNQSWGKSSDKLSLPTYVGHIQKPSQTISLNLYRVNATPKLPKKTFISDYIFPSFTTHPSHLYCSHFVHVLHLDWPTLCFKGWSSSNQFCVKISLVCTNHKALQNKYPLLLFMLLSYVWHRFILTNYRAKI